MADLYQLCLMRAGYGTHIARTGEEALAAVAAQPRQVLLLDLHLPDMNGLEILRRVMVTNPETSVVVITADGSVSRAVEAMRAGAFDFLVKPFSNDRLLTSVKNALQQRSPTTHPTIKPPAPVSAHLPRLQVKPPDDPGSFCGFIGRSAPMQTVYRAIEAAAPSNATIFITGESGTGKEVAAEAIHTLSRRRNGPMVAINCGAIPKDLIESEIFGHIKGSFTGAVADRMGAVRQADGGTLFLDEICEMRFDLQSKLLRFLQTGTFQPVGASRVEKSDLRIVCATNRNPMAEVEAGRFREDLYYRLHVVPLVMPPLRERGADSVLIASHFIARYAAEEKKRFAGLDRAAEAALLAYDWPGNIRQLQNVLRHAVVMNDGPAVTLDMLPLPALQTAKAATCFPELQAQQRQARGSAGPTFVTDPGSWSSSSDITALMEVERAAIEKSIAICAGNIPRAAAFLGVSPSTIYRKKQAWESVA